MTKLFFPVITLLLVFSACSPRITTKVFHSYASLDEDHPVVIYALRDMMPDSALIIGKLAVTDRGTSTRCSYPQVVEYAVKETRKMGGEGFKIIDHLEPSFWGSSCHQISGAVLRFNVDSLHTNELYKENSKEAIQYINQLANRGEPSKAKYNEFGLNLGGGFILNKTKGISGKERKFEDKLNRGITWDAYFLRTHPRHAMGWGMVYSGYKSSATYEGQSHNITLTYVAPMLVMGGEINKWLVKLTTGAGYLGFRNNIEESFYKSKIIGSTIGFNANLGVGYKMSENFALGVELSTLAGTFSKLNYHNFILDNPVNEDNRMGVSRVNCLVGIRFFFNR